MNELDVKAIRKKLGLTQKKLAEKLGVAEATVQNWERGLTIPATKYSILSDMLSASGCAATDAEQATAQEEQKDVVIPESVIKLLAEKEVSLRKAQEQIDRLLAVIENLTANKQ